MTDLTQASDFSFDWSYPGAFIWGLLVLISFVGWGQTVGCWLVAPNRDESSWGWGLAAAWGMATFLVLSGPMMLLSIFSVTFVALFLGAGLALAAWHARLAWGKRSWTVPAHLGFRALLGGFFLLVGLTYAGAVANQWYNSCDDFAVYFAHAKMLLDTGTLSDPFGFRLMLSLGGQQTLSTLIVAFLPWKYTHLLDNGIALVIILGLTQGLVRGDSLKAWTARLILATLALTFSMPRVNIGSQFTGTVLFLALLRSFDLVAARQCIGGRSALLLGGLVAATATLRGHDIYVVAFLGLGFVLLRWWEGEQNSRDIRRESLMTLAAAFVLLVPWWVVTYRSSGSFLYPLLKGTQRPEFEQFSAHLSFLSLLQFTGVFFVSTIYILLFCPVFFVESGRERRPLLILGGAILLISTAFISQFTVADYDSIYRYLAPVGLAFGLYSAGAVARQFVETSPLSGTVPSALRAILAVILVVLMIVVQSFSLWDASRQNILLVQWALDARHEIAVFGMPVSTGEARRDYGEAFAQIPSGSKTLIALDYPFLLDYREHSIFSIDLPGAASPEPGLPYFQGPASVKKYLLAQGIRYIAHVPFERSSFLYSRENQNKNLTGPVPAYRMYSKFQLDFFDDVDQLAKSNRILYDSPTIQVIDLGD